MSKLAERPQRADARRNRERVVAAARAVFAEHGRDAQMDDVARRAGVGVGTVYRHFPTKRALLIALVLDAFDRVAAEARRALEDPDPWEGLTHLLWYSAENLAADRALSEAMAGDFEFPGAESAAQVSLRESVAQLMRRAQAAGQLRPDAIVDDIPMLMCGVGMGRIKEHRSPEAWRRHLSIVIDGLRASSASGPLPA
ncbi:MAG TPA: helix-turn-helix domain-containing protein [Solirubrobacteraceae bacterium]|jgi:AcrR family transcriptional regulator